MSTCDDLRARRAAIPPDIDRAERDLQGAIAELKKEPHNKFLAEEVNKLGKELAGLRSELQAVDEQIGHVQIFFASLCGQQVIVDELVDAPPRRFVKIASGLEDRRGVADPRT